MIYFAVSDVHAFYTPLKTALLAGGFDEGNPNHKLIICGDLFDRGGEPLSTEAYILDLLKKNKVILIRGNHEDLFLDLVNNFDEYKSDLKNSHHYINGTVTTALKLAPARWLYGDFITRSGEFIADLKNCGFVTEILPKMVDYFETPDYVFTHGYIPCKTVRRKGGNAYAYMQNWRNANKSRWERARWLNGQYIASACGVREPNKTIVCGHIASWYGHQTFENKTAPDYSPYFGDGIIAIDGFCQRSGQINCIKIED